MTWSGSSGANSSPNGGGSGSPGQASASTGILGGTPSIASLGGAGGGPAAATTFHLRMQPGLLRGSGTANWAALRAWVARWTASTGGNIGAGFAGLLPLGPNNACMGSGGGGLAALAATVAGAEGAGGFPRRRRRRWRLVNYRADGWDCHVRLKAMALSS